MKLRFIAITLKLFLLVGGVAFADQTEDLITKYYHDILDRSPDPAAATWKADIERLVSLDIDVKEGFIALAKVFFTSEEYTLQDKSNSQYVTDLYQTFLDRTPTQAEVGAWVAYLDAGLSRNVVFNSFGFSDEFKLYMAGLLGVDAWLPECNLVNDFYRGFQGRLPESNGFNGWVDLMQNAMATGDEAVRELGRRIALGFLQSQEYILRDKSDREFLEDLYNGILRRGALKEEFDGWLEYMRAGMTREEVLLEFTRSEEFQLRVQGIIRLVTGGSWYVTGFVWPHDGKPFESDNFIIYSDGASDDAKRALARLAEEILIEIIRLFEIENNDVFLYPPGQDKIHIYTYKFYFPRNWGGWGYYGGLLIYSLDHAGRQNLGHTEPQLYNPTLKHELVHVVESLLKGDDDPRLVDVWLTEGLAEAVSGGTAGGRITDLAKMYELLKKYRSLNPIKMHRYEYPDIDGVVYYYYYPMFHLAVEYLVDINGHGKTIDDVKNLFLDVRNGVAFPTAFENRFEMSLLEYERQFFRLMNDYLQ